MRQSQRRVMVTAAMGTVYGRRAMLGARQTMPGKGRSALPTTPPNRRPDVVGASHGMGWVAYQRRDHRAACAIPLLATLGGSSAVASQVLSGVAVRFSDDATGMPWMEIEGLERVRRVVDPDATAVSAAAPAP